MTWFNVGAGWLFDLLQGPLAGLSPLLGVLLWSIPVSVFALYIFKWTSNQGRIAAVKREIQAALFEIRLFNDDLRAILRAQGEILRHVLRYQLLALKPMIWILPPVVVIMVQLHAFYGFEGLVPGRSALLKVELADGWAERLAADGSTPELGLLLPEGVVAETPGVWAADFGEVAWRLRAERSGSYTLQVEAGEARYEKTLEAVDGAVRRSPERPPSGFLDQLEWPSEAPLPADGPLRRIVLDYPDGRIGLAGFELEWRYGWMVVFFALTMVLALALRKPLGVEL